MYLKYSFDNLLEIILNYKSKRCSQERVPVAQKSPRIHVYIYIYWITRSGVSDDCSQRHSEHFHQV